MSVGLISARETIVGMACHCWSTWNDGAMVNVDVVCIQTLRRWDGRRGRGTTTDQTKTMLMLGLDHIAALAP
jgi:hypothetical protein